MYVPMTIELFVVVFGLSGTILLKFNLGDKMCLSLFCDVFLTTCIQLTRILIDSLIKLIQVESIIIFPFFMLYVCSAIG